MPRGAMISAGNDTTYLGSGRYLIHNDIGI